MEHWMQNKMNHHESIGSVEDAASGAKERGGTVWHGDCFPLDALRVEGASENDESDAREGVLNHSRRRDMEKYCAGDGVNDGSVERAERLTDGEIEEGIAANEGLVRSVVARMTGERGLEPDEDMLQMGRIALWNALRRFNPRRGMKLSSYAVPCIRNCVLDELRRRGRYRGLFVRSLQDPLGEGEEGTWEDVVADERAADPAGNSGEEERTERILRRVANLPKRDREVVELRYGLRGGRRLSQREIAEAQGVSDQRICAIHRRAIERLREPDPAA